MRLKSASFQHFRSGSTEKARKVRTRPVRSELQVPLRQVVLLQPPEALADLLGAHAADALDRLELALGGADDRLQAPQPADDAPRDAVRAARDVRQDAVAARGDGLVERVRRAGIPEQLRQPAELEQVL